MGKKKNSIQAREHNKFISITHEEEDIPSPEILSKYQSIDPKFANLVMQYTTDEQKHRHRMTSVRDKRQYRIAQGGFWFNIVALITAFVLVLVFIVLSAWLFYVKKEEWWIGGSTLVVSFISFVKIFVRSKIKK